MNLQTAFQKRHANASRLERSSVRRGSGPASTQGGTGLDKSRPGFSGAHTFRPVQALRLSVAVNRVPALSPTALNSILSKFTVNKLFFYFH